ncbi:hypothetical protein [Pseudoduganella lutea]|uniref:Uncharacterized protein n=1 Tax=Pseudoduganella lutea TaxID=321985 RepID=A0A4P6KTJ6_9BURK|nr:hypothetical protein [Pseudoduganella lutea]QBE62096.1 hypothetical protein EWM63_03120 [Pseudoduganella lutea]
MKKTYYYTLALVMQTSAYAYCSDMYSFQALKLVPNDVAPLEEKACPHLVKFARERLIVGFPETSFMKPLEIEAPEISPGNYVPLRPAKTHEIGSGSHNMDGVLLRIYANCSANTLFISKSSSFDGLTHWFGPIIFNEKSGTSGSPSADNDGN